MDDPARRSSSPAARPVLLHRAVWHALGLVIAVLVAWLIFRGYRQP